MRYEEIVQEMVERKQGHINKAILTPLIKVMEIIEPVSQIDICRDPDVKSWVASPVFDTSSYQQQLCST